MKAGYQPGKHVPAGIDHGPHVGAVAVKGTDHQTDGHAGEQQSAHPVIILFVFEKEKHDHACHIWKPQQVWDNEILVERDQIIQPRMDNMIVSGDSPLQVQKPGQIDKAVRQYPRMFPA